ncbi:hypothetical protein ACIBBD_34255 [Streptomyces sp. NPDC051315]|uniref:hypothetical protein n=1 Tax=Streptomyces sp. NPDC051315 TaxID=3365650 RepID=UPI00379DF279
MGERMSDGGDHGRRRAHPGRTASGPHGAGDGTGVEALLAAALRGGTPAEADEGERRAVAAFRAARDSGAHRAARTRHRDDWRPRGRRHALRSLKATLSVLVASLALGGVAVAAIGSARSSSDDVGAGRPEQSVSTREKQPPASSGTPAPAASADPDRPVAAQDTEARCRAWEQVGGRGRALDSTAWQRLVALAGGEKNVPAYCAAHNASASPTAPSSVSPPRGNGQGRSGNAAEAPASGGGTGNGAGSGSGQEQKADKTPKGNGKNP